MSLPTAPEIKLGRDAGWILAFYDMTRDGYNADPFLLTRDDYFADIQASLPAGLEGGSYTFLIEGLTDDDYRAIAQKEDEEPRMLELYLFYRDLDMPDFGIGTNLLGADFIGSTISAATRLLKHQQDLVARLCVTSVKRKAGARKYETVITAREMVFEHVQRRRPCGDPIDAKDPSAAVKELMKRAWPYPEGVVEHQFHAPRARTSPAPAAPTDTQEEEKDLEDKIDARHSIAGALGTIASRLEESNNQHGRGMLLIRDGKLHVGQRPVPLDTANPQPKAITLSQGLLEIESLNPIPTDPNYDPCQNGYKLAPQRKQYRLVLRGRSDLKPGDLVVFDAPTGDESNTKPPLGGAFGALGDVVASVVDTIGGLIDSEMKDPVQLYVHSVEHKLGRASGYLTTISGVRVGGKDPLKPDDPWDAHTPMPDRREAVSRKARGTVEEEAADAVVAVVRREIRKLRNTDVAEVRTFQPISGGAYPGQTSTVFRGLEPLTGRNASRRADVQRPSEAEASGVPYLTPFAWGKCGLVLPRYAGMRVAVAHRNFETDDPIDLGSFWQSGHGPEQAEDGDWWLSLPAEAPTGNAPNAKKKGAPNDYSGKVTHDLIDFNGNRVIEAGAFTIRIGKGNLGSAGTRPQVPGEDTVSIEHPKASIKIDKDGNITIKGKTIDMTSEGNINIKGKKVTVKCDSMEVE